MNEEDCIDLHSRLLRALHSAVEAERAAEALLPLDQRMIAEVIAVTEDLRAVVMATRDRDLLDTLDALCEHRDLLARLRMQKLLALRGKPVPRTATGAEDKFHLAVCVAERALQSAWGCSGWN